MQVYRGHCPLVHINAKRFCIYYSHNQLTLIYLFLFLLTLCHYIITDMAAMDLCAIDKLFKKSVPHILEKIFLSLDYESYKHCLEVNTKWKALLISESYLKIGRSLFQDDIASDEKALLNSARNGYEKEVRRLLSCSMVDVNRMHWMHWMHWNILSTPLHQAACKGHIIVVQLLLDRGADPNAVDSSGRTPLCMAAFHGGKEIVQLLLNAGGDPNKGNVMPHYMKLHFLGPQRFSKFC